MLVDRGVELLQQLDGLLGPDAIVATNTSSISITQLAAVTKRADRFIGHGTPAEQWQEAHLDTQHIVQQVVSALNLSGGKVLDFKARG